MHQRLVPHAGMLLLMPALLLAHPLDGQSGEELPSLKPDGGGVPAIEAVRDVNPPPGSQTGTSASDGRFFVTLKATIWDSGHLDTKPIMRRAYEVCHSIPRAIGGSAQGGDPRSVEEIRGDCLGLQRRLLASILYPMHGQYEVNLEFISIAPRWRELKKVFATVALDVEFAVSVDARNLEKMKTNGPLHKWTNSVNGRTFEVKWSRDLWDIEVLSIRPAAMCEHYIDQLLKGGEPSSPETVFLSLGTVHAHHYTLGHPCHAPLKKKGLLGWLGGKH